MKYFLEGTTFHTGLRFSYGPEYSGVYEEQLSELRRQFQDMMLVIIDEMSLVGSDFFYNVHRRLVDILQVDEMFADRGVMLVGDLMQIRPVQASYIFKEPKTMHNKSLFKSDASLWDSCECVELKVNKRQGVSPWTDTLNRIRVGEQNSEDVAMLEERRTTKFNDRNFDDAFHANFGNAEVNKHNTKIFEQFPGNEITIPAKISGYPQGMKPKTKNGFVEDTRFLEILRLKKGMRVIHVFNTQISDNLVNGVTGKVIDFVWRTRPGESRAHVHAIIVQFDDPKIGQDQRRKYMDLHESVRTKNGVPIFKKTIFFSRKKFVSGKKHSDKCSVEQFPLNLAYSSTSHKIQGTTMKNRDVVCHARPESKKLPAGCGYVMLSRCTSIDNVFIDENFDVMRDCTPNTEALKEAKRIADSCIAAALKEQTFDIFYVNMLAKGHLMDVKHDPFALQSSLICLVQTCFEAEDVIQQWSGNGNVWKCMPHASVGNGKGVCCFTKTKTDEESDYEFRAKRTSDKFQIVQVIMKKKRIQLFVLYVSQRANMQDISEAIDEMVIADLEIMVLGKIIY